MPEAMVRCPSCSTLLPKPNDGEKVVCPRCGQKVRFRRAAAPAGGTASPDGARKPAGPGQTISASLEEVSSAHPSGLLTFLGDADPDKGSGTEGASGRKQALLTLDAARSLWAGDVDDDDTEGHSLRQEAEAPSSDLLNSVRLAPHRVAQPDGGPLDLELGDFIGRGGMGAVFGARQTSLNRRVAVKVILPEQAGKPNARIKFVSEAVVTSALDHPNIVPIHDLGVTDDSTLFYAMKEVKGLPWSQVISEKTEAENLDILLKVCEAVAFAHDHGVLHRDLKPENVMVGDYGEVLVMDWGLAVAVTDDAARHAERLARANARGGTPAYMAPEMASGDVAAIGSRSDVYLLGGMLYEFVTGLRPHHGENIFSCLYQAMQGIVQPTALKGELVTIALRAMERDPAKRFVSVKELLGVLREYQTHRESIEMARSAGELLARGRADGSYDDLSRAMFGYEEAVRLWDRNGTALRGAALARVAYARCALEQEDFEFARTLARPLTGAALASELAATADADQALAKARNRLRAEQSAEAESIAATAEEGRRRTLARLRRGQAMTWAAAGLAALVTIVSLMAYARVAREEARREDALRRANEAAEQSQRFMAQMESEKQRAEEAEEQSRKEKEAAEAATRKAETALAEATRATELAGSAKERAEKLEREIAQRKEEFAGTLDWLKTDGAGTESDKAGSLRRVVWLARQSFGAERRDYNALGRLLAALGGQARTGEEAAELAEALAELSELAAADKDDEAAGRAIRLARLFAEQSGDKALAKRLESKTGIRVPAGAAAALKPAAPASGPKAGDEEDDERDTAAADGAEQAPLNYAAPRQEILAGTGNKGFANDGRMARGGAIADPGCPVTDDKGNIFFADRGNFRVRRINAQGRLSTEAGNGKNDAGADGGPAAKTAVGRIDGLAINRRGDLFLANRGFRKFWRVDGKTGILSTVLGNGKTPAPPAARADLIPREGFADGRKVAIPQPYSVVALGDDAIAVLLVGERPPSDPYRPSSVVRVELGSGRVTVMHGNRQAHRPDFLFSDAADRCWTTESRMRMALHAGDRFPILLHTVSPTAGAYYGTINGAAFMPDGNLFCLMGQGTGASLRRIVAGEALKELPEGASSPYAQPTANMAMGRTVLSLPVMGGIVRDGDEIARFKYQPANHDFEREATNLIAIDRKRRIVMADPSGHRLYAVSFPAMKLDEQRIAATIHERIETLHAALEKVNPGYRRHGVFHMESGEVVSAYLDRCGVRDLSPLKELPLRYLTASSNSIADLSPLRDMKRLTSLSLSGNAIEDLSPLSKLPLTNLTLSNNKIVSLEPLKGVPLRSFAVASNRVASLAPLKGMPLRTLNVDGNQVKTLAPLKGMSLETLQFSNNQVDSLEPLEGMALKGIGFSGNAIRNFTPLTKLPSRDINLYSGQGGGYRAGFPLRDADSLKKLEQYHSTGRYY